ncbi:MAG: NAD-dependent epimerase/dehydratase family protein [Halobacteriales archaeon]
MDVAILGCGYLGTELGRQLQSLGCHVIGVRRSVAGAERLRDAGFEAVRADVTDPSSLEAVPDADWLVYAASAGRGDAERAREIYVDGLRTSIEAFGDRSNPPDRLVYASSTRVYEGDGGSWVDESTPLTPETERGRILARAERVAIDRARAVGIDGTVARLAGLYGPNRYRLSATLSGPVDPGVRNRVHRVDAAGAIAYLLAHDLARGEVVLVVDDEPVDQWIFADWLADSCGEPYPPKRSDGGLVPERRPGHADPPDAKRCSNDRLRELGFSFRHPTFRSGYAPAIERYLEE